MKIKELKCVVCKSEIVLGEMAVELEFTSSLHPLHPTIRLVPVHRNRKRHGKTCVDIAREKYDGESR